MKSLFKILGNLSLIDKSNTFSTVRPTSSMSLDFICCFSLISTYPLFSQISSKHFSIVSSPSFRFLVFVLLLLLLWKWNEQKNKIKWKELFVVWNVENEEMNNEQWKKKNRNEWKMENRIWNQNILKLVSFYIPWVYLHFWIE